MAQPCYVGGCMCRAVRYEASGAARNLCFCHCASCRAAAGAPLVPWATFERVNLRITHGSLAQYRSSAAVVRGFCAACGTSLTYVNEGRAADIDVTLATLDDAAALTPKAHIWVGDKLPWVSIDDGLPQYPAGACLP